ncbi:MAG: DUF554 domain-containing protein [Chloroflexota bacterium]
MCALLILSSTLYGATGISEHDAYNLAVIGTFINVIAVVIGGTLGTILGDRLPPRMRSTAMDGLGLVVLVIGLQSALTTQNVLIILASVVLGGALGSGLGVEDRLDACSRWIERRFAPTSDRASSRFSQGFMSASLVFCVGPMTILGSIQDGLTGDFRTLAVKSLLDFFAGIAFSSTLGIGVVFSAVTVLVYQGALTLLASVARDWLSEPMVREMTAAGGILIMGIGLRLLEVKPVPVGNLLPAIIIAPLLQLAAGDWLERVLRTSSGG